MRRRMTLARQLLALQLLILLGVIVGVTAVSLAQSAEAVRRTEGRRALSAAENVAATPVVRNLLPVARPGEGSALPSAAESQRSLSGAASVVLARPNGTVVTSSDPRQVGTRMRFGDAQVPQGRSWTGLVHSGDVTRVSAQVAVQDPQDGRVVGVAVVEREYPSTLQRLRAAVPNLVTYLGIAVASACSGRCCWPSGSSGRPSGWSPARSPGWWSSVRRCCTVSRKVSSASTRPNV